MMNRKLKGDCKVHVSLESVKMEGDFYGE